MPYNLLDEDWIPVRRASGKVERIAPWRIAETADPAIRIESPRPDFDAALLEFLIGLVQTVMTPRDTSEWERLYEAGLPAQELQRAMLTEHAAFFLDGDGPRFMQDLNVHLDPKAEERAIHQVLIDMGTVGESSLFAKNGTIQELGFPAAAAALLTLQNFAPPGGRGQCTSLRGGGPLSVTIQDVTLIRTVWCNVLISTDLDELPGDSGKSRPADRMPWMGPTRTSEKGRLSTFPDDVHPLQHFWGLPRRFRLVFDRGAAGTCSVFGDHQVPVVRSFLSRPDGTSYDGPFRHPLTPYTQGKDAGKPPNPKKGSRSGVSYRDWPLLTVGGEGLIPPKVVDAFLLEERWRSVKSERVMVCGYAMDNMKPLRFIESAVPVLHAPRGVLGDLRADAQGLVAASDSVRRTLMQQVKGAWKDQGVDLPGELESRVEVDFWSATERAFHTAMSGLASALEKGDEAARTDQKQGFLAALHREAKRVFDGLCPLDAEEGPANLARTVRARQTLDRFTHPTSKLLLRLVGLLPAEDPDGKVRRKPRRKETRS